MKLSEPTVRSDVLQPVATRCHGRYEGCSEPKVLSDAWSCASSGERLVAHSVYPKWLDIASKNPKHVFFDCRQRRDPLNGIFRWPPRTTSLRATHHTALLHVLQHTCGLQRSSQTICLMRVIRETGIGQGPCTLALVALRLPLQLRRVGWCWWCACCCWMLDACVLACCSSVHMTHIWLFRPLCTHTHSHQRSRCRATVEPLTSHMRATSRHTRATSSHTEKPQQATASHSNARRSHKRHHVRG